MGCWRASAAAAARDCSPRRSVASADRQLGPLALHLFGEAGVSGPGSEPGQFGAQFGRKAGRMGRSGAAVVGPRRRPSPPYRAPPNRNAVRFPAQLESQPSPSSSGSTSTWADGRECNRTEHDDQRRRPSVRCLGEVFHCPPSALTPGSRHVANAARPAGLVNHGAAHRCATSAGASASPRRPGIGSLRVAVMPVPETHGGRSLPDR